LEYIEIINDQVADDHELYNFYNSALNSMKKFDDQKQRATPEAGKHLKKMDFDIPHPLFILEDGSNQDALTDIKNYKPS